ncbi:MAG: nuclear transport factor 2 family protein [Asticcacaulis sp.]|nr:nuclear transport factor 2 family protein [Asticcacaulis sp.]
MSADRNRQTISRYYKALQDGDGPVLFTLYDADVVQTEWPNQLKAKGDKRTLDQLKADFERGKGVMASQVYDIETLVCTDDTAAVEATWRGTLAIPIGRLNAGEVMTAHIATFFTLKDGKITSQRNYDCFEAFN